jgi:hypothetical protein
MRMLRPLAAAVAAGLLAIGAAPAGAQETPTGVQPYRFTVEGYLANYWLDRGEAAGSRASVGGYGARVMFNRSTASAVARTFFQRASAGVYGTFTTKQNGVSTQNIGGQVDASLFPTAIAAGRLDPFLSLGAGGYRIAGGPDNKTNFVLTPAVGTRIPFFSGIGFRGDLRAPIVFGTDAQVNFLAEGGVYVSF